MTSGGQEKPNSGLAKPPPELAGRQRMQSFNNQIQWTTGLADTVLAETTILADKLYEKTTVLEENEPVLFTGLEDTTA